MDDLESWLERVYQADGKAEKLDALYDQWAGDYDQQLWASGNPYIAIATGLVARHGAVIVFSLSLIAFEEYGFKQKIEELDAAGAWEKLDQSLLFRTYPFSAKEAGLRHRVLAYRKT